MKVSGIIFRRDPRHYFSATSRVISNHRPSTTVNYQSPPLNPITINDPNNSCNPTTFIQTDPSSFKQVVQLLTGKQPTRPDPVTRTHFKKPSTKLYERRPISKSFKISPLTSSGGGVLSPEVLSPSVLDFPALVLSPVTPLLPDPFCLDHEAEEKAIKEGGFYLHKSPRGETKPPRLLPLFPMMPPRDEKSSSSSSTFV